MRSQVLLRKMLQVSAAKAKLHCLTQARVVFVTTREVYSFVAQPLSADDEDCSVGDTEFNKKQTIKIHLRFPHFLRFFYDTLSGFLVHISSFLPPVNFTLLQSTFKSPILPFSLTFLRFLCTIIILESYFLSLLEVFLGTLLPPSPVFVAG